MSQQDQMVSSGSNPAAPTIESIEIIEGRSDVVQGPFGSPARLGDRQ